MDAIEEPKTRRKFYDAFRVILMGSTRPREELNAYVIAPEDTIGIWVYQVPGIVGRYVVQTTGFVSVPSIGEVRASGLTTKQLAESLTARTKNDGIADKPQVTVFVYSMHTK
ncbi:MAG: polysaccharide biosynthesis/export family protein [Bryobacteraceae bacterium]|jgi:protein involved in polysaccharide export with SLBB domain